jgi:predicted TIM-barrel fold metal-dependent hydrolase
MSFAAKRAGGRQFDFPVIDSDGHFVEFFPAFVDYFRAEAGSETGERFEAEWNRSRQSTAWYSESPEERRRQRLTRPGFWNLPTRNTLDLATAMLPELLNERLDELGSDYVVLYPGLGLVAPGFRDDEIRRASCRALNRMYADLFGEFARRMTPVALIPMHTPEEALEELDFVVHELGLKAIVMPSYVQRTVPALEGKIGDPWRYGFWLDTYGIDSDHDYDPVWAKCLELGVVPTFHSGGTGLALRNSISNYCYNHIGHFASVSDALCKSLFMGGVTRRFPDLRFSFLEGGVGWARTLLADLIAHWKKRNRDAIGNYDPANLDRDRIRELFARHGGKVLSRYSLVEGDEGLAQMIRSTEDPAHLDEWAACEIESVEDIRDLFVPSFYFGCEADDPITASAFDSMRNPLNVRLNAFYGSDIGHWDVVDMSEVLEEASELLVDGLVDEADFRDFVFANPARLWTSANPDFFAGTAVEDAVSKFLSEER